MAAPANVIYSTQTQSVYVPKKQLANLSVNVQSREVSTFKDQTVSMQKEQYAIKQRITSVWESADIANQHLMYAEVGDKTFEWSIVPYQTCKTFLGRAIQQLQVLWRIVFGGFALPPAAQKEQTDRYISILNSAPEQSYKIPDSENDAFCKPETLQKQCVVTGTKVNVLFNYAPIGFGGEKLHFLVVPNDHFETFGEVSEDVYLETMQHVHHLVDHFKNKRPSIKKVYLLSKTGVDAGQTVKHWHMHVIFSTNLAQDWFGKLSVVWNILFGARPLSAKTLASRVTDLRNELA